MNRSEPVQETERLRINVPEDIKTIVRADRFLKRTLPYLSRKTIEDWFDRKMVRLSGRPLLKGDKPTPGAVLEVLLPAPLSAVPLPDPRIPLMVLYEDPHLLILAKPGGIPTHPLDPFEKGTLVNALTAAYPRIRGVGDRLLEPGLVHRLDQGTSGLMAAALTQEAWNQMKKDLAARRWEKSYQALVKGIIDRPLEVKLPLAHDPKDARKMKVIRNGKEKIRGRAYPAFSRVRPRQTLSGHTLVEIDLITGVTHQIRVHLSSTGHPLVGDELYGGPPAGEYGLASGRQFLHASRLSLPHPKTREYKTFTLSLPDDLKAVLTRLAL